MGTVPSPHTWVTNEVPTFREMEAYLANTVTFLMNPPMIRLRKTVVQSIPNNVETAISFDFVEVETENMWDATVPTRIKPQTPGWYLGSCGFSFSGNATGNREMNVVKNGLTTERILRINHDAYTNATLTVTSRGNIFMEYFNGTTDYMEVRVTQNSGGALNVLFDTPERQPDVTLRWFAPT